MISRKAINSWKDTDINSTGFHQKHFNYKENPVSTSRATLMLCHPTFPTSSGNSSQSLFEKAPPAQFMCLTLLMPKWITWSRSKPISTSHLPDLSDPLTSVTDGMWPDQSQWNARRFLLGMLQQEEGLFFLPRKFNCEMSCSSHLCNHQRVALEHTEAERQKSPEQKACERLRETQPMVSFEPWVQHCPKSVC